MSPLRLVVALCILTTVLGSGHYYLWARLVRDTGLPSPWSLLATGGMALLGLTLLASFVLMRVAPRAVSSPLAWVGYLWLGVAFLGICSFGLLDLLRLVARAVQSGPVDWERRQHLARLASGLAGTAAFGLAAVSVRGAEAAALTVKKVKVALRNLDPSMAGLRIVQISDVHVGPTIGREFIEELVRRINELAPDVVVITGDLIDGTVAQLGELVAPLGDLKTKHGIYFSTGNHEYYWGPVEEWFDFLKGRGIRVLHNERVRIGGAQGFDLAGIDDRSAKGFGPGHGADLEKALAGREADRPVVLLAHHPRQVADAKRLGVDLQLSGHLHGGQFFPFSVIVWAVEPYFAGLYAVGDTQLYVSRGTGYWGPPMRLGAPAEITEIELTRA
jgi:predicted MPP superfamily phosphohydrolase